MLQRCAMLNSSTGSTSTEDFFHVLADNGTSRNLTLVWSIISQLIIPPGLLSIIIYEKYGSDKRRTFANKMTSSICCSGLAWGLLVHIPWIFRIIIGRFNSTTCFLMMLFRQVITNQIVIFSNAIIISRYVFIFWLKNPAAFYDEFWSFIINVWTVGFTLAVDLVFLYLPGRQPMEFYICTGQDPTEILKMNPKPYGSLKILSALIHIVIHIKIQFYKKNDTWRKTMYLQDIESRSLSCCYINVIVIAASSASTAFLFYWGSQITQPDMMIKYPHYIFQYFIYLLIPCLIGVFVVIAYFKRNGPMRNWILREVKNWFLSMH